MNKDKFENTLATLKPLIQDNPEVHNLVSKALNILTAIHKDEKIELLTKINELQQEINKLSTENTKLRNSADREPKTLHNYKTTFTNRAGELICIVFTRNANRKKAYGQALNTATPLFPDIRNSYSEIESKYITQETYNYDLSVYGDKVLRSNTWNFSR